MKIKTLGPHHHVMRIKAPFLKGGLEILGLVCTGLSLTPFHAFEDGCSQLGLHSLFCVK